MLLVLHIYLQWLRQVTYQCIYINKGNFQAKYEEEKAQEDSGLLSSWKIGMNK